MFRTHVTFVACMPFLWEYFGYFGTIRILKLLEFLSIIVTSFFHKVNPLGASTIESFKG